MIASAVVGGLVLLCRPARARRAQAVRRAAGDAASRRWPPGSIQGIVQDEKGAPIAGAIVSALGAIDGRSPSPIAAAASSCARCRPGRICVRAHLVRLRRVARADRRGASERARRRRSLLATHRRRAAAAVLAAGIGRRRCAGRRSRRATRRRPTTRLAADGDDHGEIAWRLRHARRGILKDARVPESVLADEARARRERRSAAAASSARVGSSARLATSFFGGTPFSGQVNLLTTGSFDTPQQLFTTDNFVAQHRLHRRSARRSASTPTGPCAARSRRATSRRGSSPARTRRARRRGIATTSACPTARSATTAAIRPRCATSPTAAATRARCTASTRSR